MDTIRTSPIDVDTLRELATSQSGLINEDYRRLVWPKLLGISNETAENPRGIIL